MKKFLLPLSRTIFGASLVFAVLIGGTGCSTIKNASHKVSRTVTGMFRDDKESNAVPVATQPVRQTETTSAAVAATGGAQTNAVATNPTAPAAARDYVVGPGDQLDVEVLDDPASRTTVTVGPDGKIYYYLVPGLDVWGLTLAQVRERLEQGMQQYFRESRPITVALRAAESERVWILGRVNAPGVYSVSGAPTVLEAIAIAGGPASSTPTAALSSAFGVDIGAAVDDSADLRRAFVMRDGQRLQVDLDRLLNSGDLSQNIRLQGGDFIFLPSSGGAEVSVLGAVYAGRNLPFQRNMTLVQAISAVGGTIDNAHLTSVAIVRGSLANPEIAVVNLKEIITGGSPDVQLEPRDIVYVPYTPYRTLLRYVDLILNTFVRTVGVNEGARAIDRNAGVVGVAVPIPLP